jgi:hypothetical protein
MWLMNTEKMFIMSGRCGAAWEWIESSFRPALKKSFPRLPILNEEVIRMQFKENIIVRSDLMNRG